MLSTNPLKHGISAISCGIINNKILLDLDYEEDSNADADANFVFSHYGDIIEIQCTGEKTLISKKAFLEMFVLAQNAIKEIKHFQNEAIKSV